MKTCSVVNLMSWPAMWQCWCSRQMKSHVKISSGQLNTRFKGRRQSELSKYNNFDFRMVKYNSVQHRKSSSLSFTKFGLNWKEPVTNLHVLTNLICPKLTCSYSLFVASSLSFFFSFSQTFHEVISFLYSFVTKMQEGDYDAEPKEESKVWYVEINQNCSQHLLEFALVPEYRAPVLVDLHTSFSTHKNSDRSTEYNQHVILLQWNPALRASR